MVWKRGKRGLNSGATIKFGRTNHLMKKLRFKTDCSLTKVLITGKGYLENSPKCMTPVDEQQIIDQLSLLENMEERETMPLRFTNFAIPPCHSRPQMSCTVDMSLNKRKRWEFVDNLKEYLQSSGQTDLDLRSFRDDEHGKGTLVDRRECQAGICVSLVERFGGYMFQSNASESDCTGYHVKTEENRRHSALPTRNVSSFWDLRDKIKLSLLPAKDETLGGKKKSLYHNQRFRGIQRLHVVQKEKNIGKKKKKSGKATPNERYNRIGDIRFHDGRPEVMYEVTYPRPLDASSGFQRLDVCKWDWEFRTNKSKAKCKGQKIARRADYYILNQKDQLNLLREVDADLLLYLTDQEDIDDIGYAMLGGHLSEEKLCQLEEKSHCVAEVTKDSEDDAGDGDGNTQEPNSPWGTGFELSMVKVDDELLAEEFEFLESPHLGEFEVVEKTVEETEKVKAWFNEKEDSGFVHVDSENNNDSTRKAVTLGDFIKHKNSKDNSIRKKKKR